LEALCHQFHKHTATSWLCAEYYTFNLHVFNIYRNNRLQEFCIFLYQSDFVGDRSKVGNIMDGKNLKFQFFFSPGKLNCNQTSNFIPLIPKTLQTLLNSLQTLMTSPM
jgi:hypothetical protein